MAPSDACSFTSSGATSTAIRWVISGTAQKSATASTFTPTAVDLGKPLPCSVTLANSGGSVTGTSASSKVALGAALAVVRKPTLSGPLHCVVTAHRAGYASGTYTTPSVTLS
jgi:hypothetical protein